MAAATTTGASSTTTRQARTTLVPAWSKCAVPALGLRSWVLGLRSWVDKHSNRLNPGVLPRALQSCPASLLHLIILEQRRCLARDDERSSAIRFAKRVSPSKTARHALALLGYRLPSFQIQEPGLAGGPGVLEAPRVRARSLSPYPSPCHVGRINAPPSFPRPCLPTGVLRSQENALPFRSNESWLLDIV